MLHRSTKHEFQTHREPSGNGPLWSLTHTPRQTSPPSPPWGIPSPRLPSNLRLPLPPWMRGKQKTPHTLGLLSPTVIATSQAGNSAWTHTVQPQKPSPLEEQIEDQGITQSFWYWQNQYRIRYLACGNRGPPVLCLHGFGANARHWDKILPRMGQYCRVYAMDLLGCGESDKPDPRNGPVNATYNFETWSQQVLDFVKDVIRAPTLLICNSAGGCVGLLAATHEPSWIPAVQVLNIPMREMHMRKQNFWQRPVMAISQFLVRKTWLGLLLYWICRFKPVMRGLLKYCYGDPSRVTEDLVRLLLTPLQQPASVPVLLDITSYSGGPMTEELLRGCPVPVSVVYGTADPFEKKDWQKWINEYGSGVYSHSVEEFVPLAGLGHCPQDEDPELMNDIVQRWVHRHSVPGPGPGASTRCVQ